MLRLCFPVEKLSKKPDGCRRRTTPEEFVARDSPTPSLTSTLLFPPFGKIDASHRYHLFVVRRFLDTPSPAISSEIWSSRSSLTPLSLCSSTSTTSLVKRMCSVGKAVSYTHLTLPTTPYV